MRRRSGSTIATALALVLGLAGTATASDRWLHVRVVENEDEQVHINLPLPVVEAILPHVSVDELDRGRIRLDQEPLEGVELTEILAAIVDAPDGEFVTVRSREESVRVAKENDFLMVDVEDRSSRDAERVTVRMPIVVMEALVGDGRGELDLLAALDALEAYDGEDLVRVDSDDTVVRIWIDSSELGS